MQNNNPKNRPKGSEQEEKGDKIEEQRNMSVINPSIKNSQWRQRRHRPSQPQLQHQNTGSTEHDITNPTVQNAQLRRGQPQPRQPQQQHKQQQQQQQPQRPQQQQHSQKKKFQNQPQPYHNNPPHQQNKQGERHSNKSRELVSLSQVSPDIQRMWDNVLKWSRISSLHLKSQQCPVNSDKPEDVRLWNHIWAAASNGAGDFDHVISLPVALLKLPDLTLMFPSAEYVVCVLRRSAEYVKNLSYCPSQGRRGQQTIDGISALEVVIDVIKNRLMNHLSSSSLASAASAVLDHLNNLSNEYKEAIHMLLAASSSDMMERLGLLLSKAKDINQYRVAVEQVLENCKVSAPEDLSTSAPSWKTPKLSWLLSGSWQKVEEFRNSYASPEEYAFAMESVWTLLSFYWGAAAVWPRCSHRQPNEHDSSCGEPLLAVASSKALCSFKIQGEQCGRSAAWSCHRRGHQDICNRCLRYQQSQLIGLPGLHASTDIYDAVVDRETDRREGTIFMLSSVSSRRPPRVAPNWKTTYRLQPSALVAVIKLGAGGQKLSPESSLLWAEIVPVSAQDGLNSDWRYRQEGRMALRLLSRADCAALSTDADSHLHIKSCVAIIDLRVFVPEVVSVLSTLSSPEFVSHLTQIPFSGGLIGQMKESTKFVYEPRRSVTDNVILAIEYSEIDFVRRLNHTVRSKMAAQICAIPQVQTLYGTQLEAFCGALSSAMHCTQGPPGTGKSYIGVCLVLALDIIRQTALINGQPVGPILVLSYKNHALDEFLHDITRFSNMTPGMLIRTGKAENIHLSNFSEKFSPGEHIAQEELTKRLTTLRRIRKIAGEWQDVAYKISLAYQCGGTVQSDESWLISMSCAFSLSPLLLDKDSINARKAYSSLAGVLSLRENNSQVKNAQLCLESIICGAEHWPQTQPLLWIWLNGASPPPRCKAMMNNSDIQCLQCTTSPWSYCAKYHNCSHTKNENCDRIRVSLESRFCEKHLCGFEYVDNDGKRYSCSQYERLDNSYYCEEHSCPCCLLLLSVSSDFAVCMGAPLACRSHQCSICIQPMLLPHQFCENHCCLECGRTGSLLNLPRLPHSFFCEEHKCIVEKCSQKREGIKDQDRNPSLVCKEHACRACLKLGYATFTVMNTRFCEAHICNHIDGDDSCGKRRIENSPYCTFHTCRVCQESSIFPPLGPVLEYAPRNVCAEHPLCNKIFRHGGICDKVAVPSMSYCHDHMELKTKKKKNVLLAIKGDGQCHGIAKSTRKRCKAKGESSDGGRFWCKDHMQQKDEVLKKEKAELSDDDEEIDEKDIIRDEPEPELEASVSDDESVETELSEDESSAMVLVKQITASQFKPVEFSPKRCCALTANDKLCKVQEWRNSSFENIAWFCWIHNANKPVVEQKVAEDESNTSSSSTDVKETVLEDELDPSILSLLEDANIMETNPWDSYIPSTEHEKYEGNGEYVDAVGVDIHPDEMEFYDGDDGDDDDDDSQGGNDDLNRLKDIVDRESECASEDDEFFKDNTLEVQDEDVAEALVMPIDWSWDLPHEKRMEVASGFLSKMTSLLLSLRKTADDHVAEARKLKNEAGSLAFRKARVVGATVVGASRRLEAIRAAEPFAIIVEEACEVMEPTLVSVLAVKSVQKLELVGDHRQLPAFVQNCWFNLESTLPSIKTSLFERLISGRVQGRGKKRSSVEMSVEPVPFAILDEQRRMRSCISDITKPDYADVVEILDHPQTQIQCLGDRTTNTEKVALMEHRALWTEDQRSIPGLQVPIYFWNLSGNREGRPVVGLSACNPTEASAVVALTKWLLACGVPPSCISIITPYKGQKNEIISQLRKSNCIPRRVEQHRGGRGRGREHGRLGRGGAQRILDSHTSADFTETITVSTVDRYQGDENDIVILSLVKTQPGNRFVALKNRFIVAVSRARLGFYVVGSVDAVIKDRGGSSGPDHWRRFVSCLQQKNYTDKVKFSKKGDADEEEGNEDDIDEVCSESFCGFVSMDSNVEDEKIKSLDSFVGPKLPICCPRHRSSKNMLVESPSAFPSANNWESFCHEACSYTIPSCGHKCNLPCHSPTEVPHSKQSACKVKLVRPCVKHADIPLVCGEMNLGTSKLQSALQKFECPVKVRYSRPECQHGVNISCHDNTGLIRGEKTLPACEIVVGDFTHPICNHVSKKPTCVLRRQWEKRPPQCETVVEYKRLCGCVSKVQCWQRNEFMSMTTPPLCLNEVEKKRPRCGHILSLRCCVATRLDDLWDDQNGESAFVPGDKKTLVQYGVPYGESESNLLAPLRKIRGFEGNLPNCMVPVSYKSKCSHIVDSPCSVAFDMARKCSEEGKCNTFVTLRSPFCGHSVQAPCWVEAALKNMLWWGGRPFPTAEMNSTNTTINESQLSELSSQINDPVLGVPQKVKKTLEKICSRSIIVMRSCGREHKASFRCSELLQLLLQGGTTGNIELPKCGNLVDRALPCSHTASVPCCNYYDLPPPICSVPVRDRFVFPCGVHSVTNEPCHAYHKLCQTEDLKCPFPVVVNRYRCKHSVEVACYLMFNATQSSPGEVISICTDSSLHTDVVIAGREYCAEEDMLPPCKASTSFQLLCGHFISNVPCHVAFKWAADATDIPKCEELVNIDSSPLCHHGIREVPCWVAQIIRRWRPWRIKLDDGEEEDEEEAEDADDLPVEFSEVQSSSDEYDTDLVIPWGFRAPTVPQAVATQRLRNLCRCVGAAMIVRPCNHIESISCADAFFSPIPPCNEIVNITCEKENCRLERKYPCHKFEAILTSGVGDSCMNIVPKQCHNCGVNIVPVPCSKDIVECNRRVTDRLACGHEVSWHCKNDADPRRKPLLESCIGCVIPLWDAIVDEGKHLIESCKTDSELNKILVVSVRNQALDFISKKLVDLGQKDWKFDFKLDLTPQDLAKHALARSKIMDIYKEVMRRKALAISLPPPSLREYGFLEDFYDIIIQSPSTANGTESPMVKCKQYFSNYHQKEYGLGGKYRLLSMKGIKQIKQSDDGSRSFYVCVVFRHRVLEEAAPFKVTAGNNHRKKNHHNQDANDKANEKIRFYTGKGYDCVDVMETKPNEPLIPTGERCYWERGVVIPIAQVRLKPQSQCSVCMDYFSQGEGLPCASGEHFLCWENCFFPYIESAKAPGAIGRCVDADGNLTCPGCKNAAPYTVQHVASIGGSPEALEAIMSLRQKVVSERLIAEALDEQKERLTKEFERIQQIANITERTAHMTRLRIVEDILLCDARDAKLLSWTSTAASPSPARRTLAMLGFVPGAFKTAVLTLMDTYLDVKKMETEEMYMVQKCNLKLIISGAESA
eukprot:CAMPEP_0170108520 /NCGR_PEP_ID=MMETSP0020_2-20130122/6618_1 /TAXON_ID=98059 /ORGANISM="Dinobryon sp., Strain UTEXLB2267" /LENGTH=3294 /DNA_ID=CAMNT_0010333253 /DNA_START=40 /DNA_END=9925 /DNA_ORIENTATION=+